MASGNAILAGILSGIGGAGTAIGGSWERDQKEALERARLEQERDLRQQVIDQQQAQFEATQAAAAKANNPDLAPLIAMGILPAGTGPMGKEILGEVLKFRAAEDKRLAEEGQLNTARSAILNQPARADLPMSAEGAMYSEAETLPGKAATPRNALLAAVLGVPNADAILKQMYEEKSGKIGHAPAGSAIYDSNGTIIGMVPALPKEPKEQGTNTHIVQTAQGQMAITVNAQGQEVGRVRVGDLPPRDPKEPAQPTASVTIDNLLREYQTLKRQNPSDPRLAELDQRIQAQRFTMVPPGGAPWSVASQTTGPQNPVQPTGNERTDLADMRTAIKTLDTLVQDVEANKGVLGNVVSNPVGAGRRGLSEYVPSMTTPAEKKFLASLSFQVAEIKRAFIGAAQTDPELRGMLDLLPDKGQADVNVLPRLQAIRDYTSRKYGERQAPFQGGRGGAAPKRIKLDAQGNPVP